MPHLSSVFSFGGHGDEDTLQEMDTENSNGKRPYRRPSLLKRPFNVFKRHQPGPTDADQVPQTAPTELATASEYFAPPARRPSCPETVPRRAIPSLPRPQTFRRQESERRDRLLEVEPSLTERRTTSTDRRQPRGISASAPHRPRSPKPMPLPSISAPAIGQPQSSDPASTNTSTGSQSSASRAGRTPKDLPPLEIPQDLKQEPEHDDDIDCESQIDRTALEEEFDRRWVLNLSMHFRDKSNREKFFVTYAERPNQWRRVTISLDYRNAPDDSLEADLSTLHYQRDKSLRIYEAIRESLPAIQYYDTVTNLKLETTADDNQLHVHVREDANEIIHYPSISLFQHVRCPRFNESSLAFDSHLSGFVYKVRLGDRTVIKKEIPGPGTVDEFLYEVNALDSLIDSQNVVQLEGLVTDDRGELVKGLLISYASQGALVDMLYDFRSTSLLPWHRREKWAMQIVNGLAEIHEAGFVQGDFTLSNIVIDDEDNAQIIDINRRGCPVGWEPPELGRLIDSGQRIGMCIGVKTDLYQLGMVLWALAEIVDEPERVERPLYELREEVPRYFHRVVKTCLSVKPQGRSGAKELLHAFPASAGQTPASGRPSVDFLPDLISDRSMSQSHRSDKEYIDPAMAVTIADVKDRRRSGSETGPIAEAEATYVEPDSNPTSTTYQLESAGSWVIGKRSRASRGRSPVSSRRRRSSPFGRSVSSATSFSERSPHGFSRNYCAIEPPDVGLDQIGSAPASATVPQAREHEHESQAEQSDEPAVPLLALNKRLTALHLQDTLQVSSLMHVDSGFDETMDEMIAECSDFADVGVHSSQRSCGAGSEGGFSDDAEPPASRKPPLLSSCNTPEPGQRPADQTSVQNMQEKASRDAKADDRDHSCMPVERDGKSE